MLSKETNCFKLKRMDGDLITTGEPWCSLAAGRHIHAGESVPTGARLVLVEGVLPETKLLSLENDCISVRLVDDHPGNDSSGPRSVSQGSVLVRKDIIEYLCGPEYVSVLEAFPRLSLGGYGILSDKVPEETFCIVREAFGG